MEIIIAGHGFVGKAVANTLKDYHIIHIVDPKINDSVASDYKYAEGIIICVGTPSDAVGDCDIGQIVAVMNTVPVQVPVLIKSTIPPDYLKKILKLYPDHSICYSPEFLRAATANEDFLNQTYMILGGTDPFEIWDRTFRIALPKLKTIFHCTIAEASMTKYAINTFLSVKVTFFNQLFDMCRANNIDFNTVTSLLKLDDRIGSSHTQVPGSDGSRGFGGACFPKDTNAFVHFADRSTISHTLVESAIKYNKKIRKTLT
jgi:UDPglucose 6-dehydrogenase